MELDTLRELEVARARIIDAIDRIPMHVGNGKEHWWREEVDGDIVIVKIRPKKAGE